MQHMAKVQTLDDAYDYFCKLYPDIKISRSEYREICTDADMTFVDKILMKGKKLYLGANMGFMQIVRVKRNFENLIIDWPSTNKTRIDGEIPRDKDGKPMYIYYTDDYHYKWYWCKKKCKVANKAVYAFKATRGKKGNKGKIMQTTMNDGMAFSDFELHDKYKP